MLLLWRAQREERDRKRKEEHPFGKEKVKEIGLAEAVQWEDLDPIRQVRLSEHFDGVVVVIYFFSCFLPSSALARRAAHARRLATSLDVHSCRDAARSIDLQGCPGNANWNRQKVGSSQCTCPPEFEGCGASILMASMQYS